MKKLIAIDLDGTLLSWNKKISDYNKKVINRVLERGHVLLLATGRQPHSTLPYAKELQLEKYCGFCACYNGAYLFDYKNQKIIQEINIEIDELKELFNYLDENKLDFTIYDDKYQYVSTNRKFIFSLYRKLNGRIVADISEVFTKNINVRKVIINDSRKNLERIKINLEKKFGDRFFVTLTSPFSVEVNSKKGHKGEALECLANELGINLENTIAIGNHGNDISMVEMAGIGVAVKNSTDDLKKIADEITDTNNNDGVGKYLEKLLEKGEL